MQYPLSRDEHAAITRYLSGITKQLQDVSALFAARYGNSSEIAESAVKAVASSRALEHQLMLLENAPESHVEEGLEAIAAAR